MVVVLNSRSEKTLDPKKAVARKLLCAFGSNGYVYHLTWSPLHRKWCFEHSEVAGKKLPEGWNTHCFGGDTPEGSMKSALIWIRNAKHPHTTRLHAFEKFEELLEFRSNYLKGLFEDEVKAILA